MEKLGLELGKSFFKSTFGGGGSSSSHGGSGGSGGYGGGHGGMTTSEFLREAKKFAHTKGISTDTFT